MKKPICGIYKIESEKGSIYIGQSRNIKKRFNSYFNMSGKNKGMYKLYNSFKKYGIETHKFSIIEECELLMLNERERFWQDHYDVINRHTGLNCVLTDTSEKPKVISEETRKRMSEASKIRMAKRSKEPGYKEKMKEMGLKRVGIKMPPFTDEHRRRMSESQKGKKRPYQKKPSVTGELNPMWGKVQTEKTKELIRAKAIGRLHNQKAKDKMSETRSLGRNVHAKMVLNMETGIYYDCAKEGWISTGNLAHSTFRSKMNGKIKTPTAFRYV